MHAESVRELSSLRALRSLRHRASVSGRARVLSHETLTTTVLFDREIVRILNKHCVMCHVENGPSFPLETYEQTWLQGRKIRADVIARHMPPWAAVPGYGQFVNDNSLTLRETQFIVSWVEGLGPRNAGTVFTNVVDAARAAGRPCARTCDFGHWQLGEPDLTRQLAGDDDRPRGRRTASRAPSSISGLTAERRVRALEYMPGDRRVVRAAFFTVQETGQWIGSWTPWYGFVKLPAGRPIDLPAGSHIVAEIHYRGAQRAGRRARHARIVLRRRSQRRVGVGPGARSEGPRPRGARAAGCAPRRACAADTYALALRPESRQRREIDRGVGESSRTAARRSCCSRKTFRPIGRRLTSSRPGAPSPRAPRCRSPPTTPVCAAREASPHGQPVT